MPAPLAAAGGILAGGTKATAVTAAGKSALVTTSKGIASAGGKKAVAGTAKKTLAQRGKEFATNKAKDKLANLRKKKVRGKDIVNRVFGGEGDRPIGSGMGTGGAIIPSPSGQLVPSGKLDIVKAQIVSKEASDLGLVPFMTSLDIVKGSVDKINESLKNIGKTYGLSITELDMCLKDENLEEKILEKLLNAQKEYKINSTPTIFINDKKYKGDHKFKDFKKEIEKLL